MLKLNIVIATCNRASLLKDCLESICRQESGDFTFDVIIADNNSTDDTKKIAEIYKTKLSGRLQYLFQPVQGKVNALNQAVQHAQGDILIFTDDDVTTDSRWLINIVECFKKYDCDGVGGRILPSYPPETPEWVKKHARQLAGPIVLYDLGEEVTQYVKPHLEFLGANFAFKRQVFSDCGLFRTDIGPGTGAMGEDTEFVNRAVKANKVLYYSGKALVWHPVDPQRMTLRYFAKWYMSLGRYRFLVDEKGLLDTNLPSYFGVPRYLIRQIFGHVILLALNVFNKTVFLREWRELTIKLGRMQAMRQSRLAEK